LSDDAKYMKMCENGYHPAVSMGEFDGVN